MAVTFRNIRADGQEAIQFRDEGIDLGTSGTVNIIDFTGSGVTATRVGNTLTIAISGGGGGGSPGGSNTQLQYNNAGSFGGITGVTSNGTSLTVSSGNLKLSGATSGTTTLNSAAVAGTSTLTLPAATDTLVGKATTDTFTNKTFDTAGTGNSLLINGLAATANTGTGAVVRASSPTLVTPDLGTPSALVGTNITGTAAGLSIGGNASTATVLQTARTINGVSFNGSANITITAAASSIVIGTTTVTSGSSGNVLYNNSGTLGEMTTTGSGTVLVLATSPTLTTPRFVDGGSINDSNGNELVEFDIGSASAVNHVLIRNGATTVEPHILATGSDTNIGLHLQGKGTGLVVAQDGTDPTKRIAFDPSGGATGTRTRILSSQTADRTLTLPDATTTLVGTDATQTLSNKTINGAIGTGVHDYGGADSFEMPNSAAPTVNADGEIATDTTVADFSHGIIKHYSGEELAVVSMPVAQLTSPVNGYSPVYDSTADEFQMKSPTSGRTKRISIINFATIPGSSGNVWFETAGITQTNDRYPQTVIRFKDTSTKDTLGIRFMVPSDFASGAKIYVLCTSTATSGNFVLDFDYSCASTTSSLDPSADEEALTVTQAAPGSSQTGVLPTMTITDANIAANQILQGALARDGASGSDTMAADLVVYDIFFEYVTA